MIFHDNGHYVPVRWAHPGPAPSDIQKEKKRLRQEATEKRKEDRKQEAEEKKKEKEAQKIIAVSNRKIVQLASKTVQTLGNCLKAQGQAFTELFAKLGLPEDDQQIVATKSCLDELKMFQQAASKALQAQAKGNGAELQQLPYQNEKEANSMVREVTGHVNALKALLQPAPKVKSKAKAKAKAAAC